MLVEQLLKLMGQKNKANSFPVTLPSDADPINVNTGNADPATGARQTTGNTTLASILTALQGTLNVNSGNADPATGARQTTGNTTLASILTALQGTLNMQRVAPGTTSYDVSITSGQSIGASAALAGRSPLRLIVGAAWTAADITIQTSADNATWADLYDAYGSVYTIKAAASRSIILPVADLIGINYIRLRSGTPTTPVTQTSGATLSLITQVL
ncbi:hypothetical protein [Deinococcus hopiensis]|uniref:Uncharacterized protein n=1 Tax=Deinococcus hopiensis KR-140 TaxID=695939 RepID=A0A1W1VIT5_9DEIO|nr:hypothetical protein [Deinococcus hopiensis]SMB93238.1 hypothetical protein SAMN00790413_01901 [Deinococcus hopiensis KR-140]